jgi:type II secretory pathway pseudopilin PulG
MNQLVTIAIIGVAIVSVIAGIVIFQFVQQQQAINKVEQAIKQEETQKQQKEQRQQDFDNCLAEFHTNKSEAKYKECLALI